MEAELRVSIPTVSIGIFKSALLDGGLELVDVLVHLVAEGV